MEKEMQDIREHTEKARLRLEKTIRCAKLYAVSVIAAALIISAGLAVVVKSTWAEGWPIAVGFSLFIYAFFALEAAGALLPPTHVRGRGAKNDILPRNEYPHLYACAGRAAAVVGLTKTFVLCRNLQSEAISVTTQERAEVYLPPVSVHLLAEEELYQIFLHEFAHVVNGDALNKRRYFDAKDAFSTDRHLFLGFMKTAFFYATSIRLEFAVERFTDIISLLCEQLADEASIRYGDPQMYVNATAKTLLLGRYLAYPRRALIYDYFIPEKAPDNYYATVENGFLSWLPENGKREENRLLRELPAKVASHPTLSMRMRAAKVSSYDLSAREVNEAYRSETEKYLRECERIRQEWEGWEEARRNNYIEPKARMEAYEAQNDAADFFTAHRALEEYLAVDRTRAEQLAERLLSEDDTDVYANYVLGYVLDERDDPRALTFLKKAVDHAVYGFTAVAFNAWAQACLESGDEALVAEMRAAQPVVAQENSIDLMIRRYRFKNATPASLAPTELSERTVQCFAKAIKAAANGAFNRALLCKSVKGTVSYNVLVLVPDQGISSDSLKQAQQNVGYVLDYFDRKDALFIASLERPASALIQAAERVGIDLLK